MRNKLLLLTRAALALVLLTLAASTAAAQFKSNYTEFLRPQATDPNCSQVGQTYYNTSTQKQRVCTATGTPGTWADTGGAAGGSTSTNGQSVLGADFSLTGSTFIDTGLSVSLPSAGTYDISATVVSNMNCASGCATGGPDLYLKFFNSSDAADVSNSLVRVIDITPATYFVRTTGLRNIVTVAAAKTIKLYANRNSGTYTLSNLLANSTDGYTRMQYVKLN